jgi:Protein of unknown function (DUF3995)
VRRAAVGMIAALGALHAAWAAGSSWPCADRRALAAAVGGFEAFPGTAMTAAVSAALFAAAGMAAADRGTPAVAAVFAARGIAGLARPDLLPAGEAPPFARLNARYYSPLCLALAAALLVR